MDWDEKQIYRLRELWAQTDPQLSANAIAVAMNMTKNAVVGKAHRLNLPSRPSPIRRRDPDAPVKPKRERGGAAAQAMGVGALLALPPARVVEKVPPLAKGVSKPCCWPLGDPKAPDFGFCGARGVPGRPYCRAHLDRAFVSGPMRAATIRAWEAAAE